MDTSTPPIDDVSESTLSHGRTILSSLAPSSLTDSFREESCVNDGTVPDQTGSSLSLSLDLSLLDSSVLLPSESDVVGGLERLPGLASSPESSISSSSTSSNVPYLFENIGRSLVLASNATGSEGEGESPDSPSAKRTKWWDQLRTDEEWGEFRARAKEQLNVLLSEEMRNTTRPQLIDHDGCSSDADDMSSAKEIKRQRNEGYPKVRQWLQGLRETLTAATVHGVVSVDDSNKSTYFTSTVKEMVAIRQELERLPPTPPTLPEEIPLEDLPRESRDMLIQYRHRLDSWREQSMPLQEELTKKYVQCQEALLAAIIDAEETQFWGKESSKKSLGGELNQLDAPGIGNKWNTLNAVDNEGHIEDNKTTPKIFDDVNDTHAISGKCQSVLRAAFAAATVVAGFLLTLQTKRR